MANLMEKALAKGSQPSKEEFTKLMFPIKQVLGLAIGTALGFLGLTGIFTIGIYFVLSTVICYLYTTKYLEVDEDEVDQSAILTESLGAGFASFMLTWVLTYSLLNSRI